MGQTFWEHGSQPCLQAQDETSRPSRVHILNSQEVYDVVWNDDWIISEKIKHIVSKASV
jgi:hypothetical protein